MFIVLEQQEEGERSVWEVDRVSVHRGAGGLRRSPEEGGSGEDGQQSGTLPNPSLQYY